MGVFFNITNESQRDYCIEQIRAEELPFRIDIGSVRTNRSAQQNALMWKWNTEIGMVTGQTKDEVHFAMKEKYAVPIFMRDDHGYNVMIFALRKLKGEIEYQQLRKQIIDMTSTTSFSVEQMTEYLDHVCLYGNNKGVSLTIPPDMRWLELTNYRAAA